MLINVILELLDDFVFEADSEHYLEVAGSDTHMSKDIREVSSINQNNGLYVGGDFLLSIYFFTQKDGPSFIGLMHDFLKVLYLLNIAPATNRFSLAYDKPVAEVSALSDLGIDLLKNHGETEEESATENLLREYLIGFLGKTELLPHELALILEHMLDLVIDLPERLLDTIGNTFDLFGVFLVHTLRGQGENQLLPIFLAY